MNYRIGALTISQSPRYDLLAPLYAQFPAYEIIEVGALDTVNTANLSDATDTDYPLRTTLLNGKQVTLDRDFLVPLVQKALNTLEAQGVDISILLCAGDFPGLRGELPLVKPTDVAQTVLRAMSIQRVAVISPFDIQQVPIKDKWTAAGFEPVVWTMPPDTSTEQQATWMNNQLWTHRTVTCVVLDYVGYPEDAIGRLQQQVEKPVFELGHLALSAVSSVF